MKPRQIIRNQHWHLWIMPGYRFGVGLVPLRNEKRQAGDWSAWSAMIWFGPLLFSYTYPHRTGPMGRWRLVSTGGKRLIRWVEVNR